jgi:hypothetical protein
MQPNRHRVPGALECTRMTDREEIAAPSNRFARAFNNPIMTGIAWVAGVLGLILSVYFYIQSEKKRDLAYYVNPAQAVVVQTGESSNLHVFFGNHEPSHELTSDVTAAQIAIWNEGNESIRPDNVLRQVVIRTIPSVPILETSIRKKSRDVVNVTLDQSHLNDGVVGIQWNILEQNDEAIIQIVYAGRPPINQIQVSGVIEGQGNIRQLRDVQQTKNVSAKPLTPKQFGTVFFIVALIMAIVGVVVGITKATSPSIPPPYVFAIMTIVLVAIGIFSILYFAAPPPIDFQ